MGDLREPEEPTFTMDEVRKHTSDDDAWLVVGDGVYDITNFWKKHPGGQKMIMAHAGFDASHMYNLYHHRKDTVTDKFLKIYRKGKVEKESIPERNRLIDADFIELTETFQKLGFFKANYLHVLSGTVQCMLTIALSIWITHYFGNGVVPMAISAFVLGFAWIFVSYIWHDFCHRGVTHSVPIDYACEIVFCNVLLGFCATFATLWHNLHHASPHNTGAVLKKSDSDEPEKDKPKMAAWKIAYNVCTTPPALFPYLWTIASVRLSYARRDWLNLVTLGIFYMWYIYAFYPQLGFWKCVVHWIIARQFWSHLVFYTSLANHLDVSSDRQLSTFEYQAMSSINLTQDSFTTWLTGGQNGQIEHHLWPALPRENLIKAAPYVKSLCDKWDIPYKEKTVVEAFRDVFIKLRTNPKASRPYETWHMMMYKTS